MFKFVTFISLVVAASAQGWDPRYCCYPVPEECCSTPQPCPPCVDLSLIVDISSSIGNVRLQNVIVPFLKLFATTDHWVIGHDEGQYQVSCTTFANQGSVMWNWQSPETQGSTSLEDAFGTLTTTQFQGLTNTGDGLQVTRLQVLEGPGNRRDCEDVCILITDGQVNQEEDKFADEAPLFKDGRACDLTIVVGISTAVSEAELLSVATSTGYLILLPSAIEDLTNTELESAFDQIAQMICDGLTDSTASESDACCPYEYPYYFQLSGKYH